MQDAYTLKRRQWLGKLPRRYKKNMRGIEAEELTWYLSERLALIICATIAVAVIMEILK